jgi:hypothetical protein
VYRLADTRVFPDSIVGRYREGLSAESIAESFPALTLEQVYGATAFYLANKKMLGEYVREGWELARELQSESRRRGFEDRRRFEPGSRNPRPAHDAGSFCCLCHKSTSPGVILVSQETSLAAAIDELSGAKARGNSMCQICASMLAAEHKKKPKGPLCPKCKRFPLAAEVAFDPSQWDYVAPGARQPAPFFQTAAPTTPIMPGMNRLQPVGLDLEDILFEETGSMEKEASQERTCYHCYQVDSGLAERCPVCGDSYLPAALRKPHLA